MLKIMIAKTWPLENRFSAKIFLYIYSFSVKYFLTFSRSNILFPMQILTKLGKKIYSNKTIKVDMFVFLPSFVTLELWKEILGQH